MLAWASRDRMRPTKRANGSAMSAVICHQKTFWATNSGTGETNATTLL